MAVINKNFLSTGRINTSGGSPQARAPFFNNPVTRYDSRIFAGARVRPSLIDPPFSKPLVDRVGPIVKADSVTQFTETMMDASLRVADLTHEYEAREAVVDINDKLRDIGFNQETGYFLTRGSESLKRRKETQDRAEKMMLDQLMVLEPQARLKAMPAVNRIREQFLDDVGSFAASQFNQWKEDVQTKEVQNLAQELPKIMHDPQLTENTISEGLKAIYPDNNDGSVNAANAVKRKLAYNKLSEALIDSLIFSPLGITGAKERFVMIEDRLDVQTRVNIIRSLDQAIATYNSRERARESDQARDLRDAQNSNAAKFLARALRGEKLNAEEIASHLDANQLTASQGQTLFNEWMQPGKIDTDYGTYADFLDDIYEMGGRTGNSSQLAELEESIWSSEELKAADKKSLLDKLSSLRTSDRKAEHSRALNVLKAWTLGPSWTQGHYQADKALDLSLALDTYWANIGAGMTPQQSLDAMDHWAKKHTRELSELPSLWNGMRPRGVEDIPIMNRFIRQAHESGTLTDDQARAEYKLLKSWGQAIQAIVDAENMRKGR